MALGHHPVIVGLGSRREVLIGIRQKSSDLRRCRIHLAGKNNIAGIRITNARRGPVREGYGSGGVDVIDLTRPNDSPLRVYADLGSQEGRKIAAPLGRGWNRIVPNVPQTVYDAAGGLNARTLVIRKPECAVLDDR